MRTQSTAQQDTPLVVTPKVNPRMPWRVVSATPLPGFQLRVSFVDGTDGTVDLTGFIHSSEAGVFAKLADPALFAQVHVVYGAVTWPGGIDLAPDAMYAKIKSAAGKTGSFN